MFGKNDQNYERNIYPKHWIFPPVSRPYDSLIMKAPYLSFHNLNHAMINGTIYQTYACPTFNILNFRRIIKAFMLYCHQFFPVLLQ